MRDLFIFTFRTRFKLEREYTLAITSQLGFVPIDTAFLCNISAINHEPRPNHSGSPYGPEHQKDQKIGVKYSSHSGDSIG